MSIELTRELRQRAAAVSRVGKPIIDLYSMFFNPIPYVEAAQRDYERDKLHQEAEIGALSVRMTMRNTQPKNSAIGVGLTQPSEAPLPVVIRMLTDAVSIRLEPPGVQDPAMITLLEDARSYRLDRDGLLTKKRNPTDQKFLPVDLSIQEGVKMFFDSALLTVVG